MDGTQSRAVSLLNCSQRIIYSPRASAAVIRFLGFTVNILVIRSFALADIEGHGELCKSSLASRIAANMAFLVSKKIY
jgi:hypothetical protein